MVNSLYDFYYELKAAKIMFCYSGPVAQSGIEGVAATLCKKLQTEEVGNSTYFSVLSIFVEQVQNILNYSAERLGNSEELDNELRVGIIAIGHDNNGDYFIYCGNRIYNADIQNLKEKLDYINSLNKEELKVLYKERRRMAVETGRKGAGLGLIEMARRTGGRLEYSFKPIDNECSFFSIRVTVGR